MNERTSSARGGHDQSVADPLRLRAHVDKLLVADHQCRVARDGIAEEVQAERGRVGAMSEGNKARRAAVRAPADGEVPRQGWHCACRKYSRRGTFGKTWSQPSAKVLAQAGPAAHLPADKQRLGAHR